MTATRPARRGSIALPYAERQTEIIGALPGADVAWLRRLREDSLATAVAEGLPSQRVERWKYTNLNALAQASLETAANQALGGTWAGDEYPAPKQHGTIQMTKTIRVLANCGNDDTTKYKDFVIRTKLSATDAEFAAPARVQTSVKTK